MKRKALNLASTLSVSQPLISLYDNFVNQITPKLNVCDEISSFELRNKEREGYILLTLIPGIKPTGIFTLATAFKLKGYQPIILYNNGMLPIKPSTRYYTNSQAALDIQRYRINLFEKNFRISPISINDILDENYDCDLDGSISTIDSFNYNGIDLSPYAVASTRKYLQKYTLNNDEDRVMDPYRKFIKAGAIMLDSTQWLVNKFDIEAALLVEPAYVHGGIPAKICSKNGINAYTRGGGYQFGKVSFGRASNRNPFPNFANEETVLSAINTGLSSLQKNRVQEVMKRRETGEIVSTYYTTENKVSVDSSKDHIVGIFSHLLWDGALAPKQSIYRNIFDWLSDIINIGAQNKNTHFVIKSHPAELIKGTDQSVGDWIEQTYDTLPSNFTFLPPDTDVNTYSLIRDLDAGIVYASTVGLEMAYHGVPVITGGYPPYHGFGVTHDPKNQAEFKTMVKNIKSLDCNKNMKKKAKRLAYLLFVSKCFDYPYSSIESGQHIYITQERILSNDAINNIVNRILNGKEVIKPHWQHSK
ncbi:capsular polysaccharide export protein, LipB/KpsS family [Haloquadratum walsbyi]|uniref:Capsule polysaccharide biosynthesis protein n=1 Tax=Haloquadratum walsbyi (strain DSM 16854 / JCM 12705 / C23) TaxID=768065 RepID=G0LM78_HALWC|nr:hypothetical protein [Haloquadratum walsbyi]CCC41198.1 uncharacterized protein Hqrw_3435 [Haloquadratum walsbyi C23]